MTDSATSVTCTVCDAGLSPGSRFCTTCGTPQNAGASSAEAPQAPPEPNGFQASWERRCTHCTHYTPNPYDPLDGYCRACRKLQPLGPGYTLPVDAYMWALDAQMMSTLRGITPLNAAARALSDKVGRPWLEAAVNGLRLGPDQLPDIFALAVKAGRIIGLPYLPEMYISGEQMWECMTLGSDNQAFIVVGSIVSNFKAEDMLYILAREMGHIAAGHTVWKTLMQFTSGRQQNKTIGGHGVLQFLNPAKIVESAIDAPLMAWSRHAEITADRAGALVVGQHEVARRVAIQWTLKSFPLFPRINLEALERDVAQSDDRQLQVSEWTMSSTPYLARRLRIMNEFFASEALRGWRAVIEHWIRPAPPLPKPRVSTMPKPAVPEPTITDAIKLACISCHEVMRVPREDLEGKTEARVRCPNPACGKVLEITPKPPDKAEVKRIIPPSVKLTCVACGEAMQVPLSALVGKAEVNIRCPNAACQKILTVRPPQPATLPDTGQGEPSPEPPPRPAGDAAAASDMADTDT